VDIQGVDIKGVDIQGMDTGRIKNSNINIKIKYNGHIM
jgi:hypothetical protein